MGEFVVDADVMARARFGTSPLAETLGALMILVRPDPLPWHRAWREVHVGAFRARLADDPVAAALVAHAFGPTWIADFLSVPPPVPDLTLDEELAHLESLGDDRIRADLVIAAGALAPALAARGLAPAAAALLRWVWTSTLQAEWPRRRRVLRADIVSRTSRLSGEGWAGVVRDLDEDVRWLGEGRLQVNAHPYPPRDIRGRDLLFIAAHTRGRWISWRLPDRYAVVYPVTGIFSAVGAAVPDPLARLLGTTRARVLVAAEGPVSTSALAATTRLPLGSVGGHLRVLLDAGLLERRRAGREVLYWWTVSGRALVRP